MTERHRLHGNVPPPLLDPCRLNTGETLELAGPPGRNSTSASSPPGRQIPSTGLIGLASMKRSKTWRLGLMWSSGSWSDGRGDKYVTLQNSIDPCPPWPGRLQGVGYSLSESGLLGTGSMVCLPREATQATGYEGHSINDEANVGNTRPRPSRQPPP